jgi:leader peptidase (prepilin peptidase)/N-methyltransferase
VEVLAAFIFGAAVGSFLDVVSLRLIVRDQFIRGPSRCPQCNHALGPLDLVPILSFIVLRRRCRYCGRPIAWHYFLVEVAMGVVFALTVASTGISIRGVFLAVELSLLAVLFLTDLRAHVLPDEISLPAIALAVLGVLFFGQSISGALLGAAVAGGFFLVQYLVSRGRWIGGGDIRLGFLLGLLLGWPLALVALFLAYMAGGVVSALLLVARRRVWGSHIPFGTFLTAATAVAIFFGPRLLALYGATP